MSETVQMVGGLLVIFLGLCTIFNYVVISPLKEQIGRLATILDKYAAKMDEHDTRIHGLDNRIIAIEQDIKSIHRRLDNLEDD